MKNNNMKLIMENWNKYSKEQEGFNILTEELKKISNSQQTNVLLEEGLTDFLTGLKGKIGKAGQLAALVTTLASAFAAPSVAHASEPTAAGPEVQTAQQVQAQETKIDQTLAQVLLGYLNKYIESHDSPQEKMNLNLKLAPLLDALDTIADGGQAQIPKDFSGFLETAMKNLGSYNFDALKSLQQDGARIDIN